MANVNLTDEDRYKLGFLRNGTEYLRDTIGRLIDAEIKREGLEIPFYVAPTIPMPAEK